MGFKKLLFPIALALAWILMAALAMVDFAGFSAATRPSEPAVAHEHVVRPQARPQPARASAHN